MGSIWMLLCGESRSLIEASNRSPCVAAGALLLCGESRSLIEAHAAHSVPRAEHGLLCGESRSLIEAIITSRPVASSFGRCSAVKAAASLKHVLGPLQRLDIADVALR